jgi:invasion protein IalB
LRSTGCVVTGSAFAASVALRGFVATFVAAEEEIASFFLNAYAFFAAHAVAVSHQQVQQPGFGYVGLAFVLVSAATWSFSCLERADNCSIADYTDEYSARK